MKNKIFSILFALILFGFSVVSVEAAVRSGAEISYKISILKNYENYDFIGLVNKAEIIGARYEAFEMATSSYANQIRTTYDGLQSIKDELEIVEYSNEISDTDRAMQRAKLLKDADKLLNELDTSTFSYLIELRRAMPSITYSRFSVKFTELYNSLDITERDIKMGK